MLSARKGLARATASLSLQARELPHAAPALQNVIESLRAQQKQRESQIRQITQREDSLELSQRLQTVPGIGPIVVATLTSRLAAQSNLKTRDSPFKAHYARERAKGLPSTARCAVARKLARLAWSLHAHNTTYQPQRVYQKILQPNP